MQLIYAEGIWCPYEEWGMEVGWPPFGNKPITTSMSIAKSTNYVYRNKYAYVKEIVVLQR